MSDTDAVRLVDLEVRPPKQERSRAAWNRVLDAESRSSRTAATTPSRSPPSAVGPEWPRRPSTPARPARTRFSSPSTSTASPGSDEQRVFADEARWAGSTPVALVRSAVAEMVRISLRHQPFLGADRARSRLRTRRWPAAGPATPRSSGTASPASCSWPPTRSRTPIPRPRSAPASRRSSPRRSSASAYGPDSPRRRRSTTTRSSPTWARRRCAPYLLARAPGSTGDQAALDEPLGGGVRVDPAVLGARERIAARHVREAVQLGRLRAAAGGRSGSRGRARPRR